MNSVLRWLGLANRAIWAVLFVIAAVVVVFKFPTLVGVLDTLIVLVTGAIVVIRL